MLTLHVPVHRSERSLLITEFGREQLKSCRAFGLTWHVLGRKLTLVLTQSLLRLVLLGSGTAFGLQRHCDSSMADKRASASLTPSSMNALIVSGDHAGCLPTIASGSGSLSVFWRVRQF